MRLGIRWRGVATAFTAATLCCACTSSQPALTMNDYVPTGAAQRVWPFHEQMFFVLPVPTFNVPVRIRSVELRTIHSVGQFDPPAAYLLRFSGGGDYYKGYRLAYKAGLDLYAGSAVRMPLDASPVQKLDQYLTLVVPVNINERGCHEAQVVLHVTTSDGHSHTRRTRWYVALDTGVSKTDGDNYCAGPRDNPSPVATSPPPSH